MDTQKIKKPKGRWVKSILYREDDPVWECSECGFERYSKIDLTDYCGGCGKRMEEVQ